jgi:serine protease Do
MEVERVETAGAAARAGIKSGDVVVRLGDVVVHHSLDFERALLQARPGDQLAVRVRRPDGEQQLELVLQASTSSGSPNDLAWRRMGIRLTPASSDAVARGGSNLRGGLLITEVNPDSPAYRAGVQKGDILVGLHQWETINMDGVAYVLQHQDLATFYPLKVFLLRGRQVHSGWLQAE